MNTEVAETDEIEEAAQRLLAFLPEETRAMLGNAKHILGMSQLVAENAKRCGVEVSGDDWDWGLGNEWWVEAWSICGIDFTISEPDDSDPWTAVQRRGSKPKIEAPTFPELFDKIVAAVTSGDVTPDEPNVVCSGPSYDWNGWPCPALVGRREIYAVDRSVEADRQGASGNGPSPEYRVCLSNPLLWTQQTESDG